MDKRFEWTLGRIWRSLPPWSVVYEELDAEPIAAFLVFCFCCLMGVILIGGIGLTKGWLLIVALGLVFTFDLLRLVAYANRGTNKNG